MSVRVHELAKELKISTGALQKHLKDLGIVVKSHMSHLDEDSAGRVRNLFQQERDINQKREQERKKYLAARIKEKQQERRRDIAAQNKIKDSASQDKRIRTAPPKDIDSTKDQSKDLPPKDLPQGISEKPTFIEKPFDKKITEEKADRLQTKKQFKSPKPVIDKEDRHPDITTKSEKQQTSKPKHKPPEQIVINPEILSDIEKKEAEKKKSLETSKLDDQEAKLKHIQAKIKHTKKSKKKKKTLDELEIEEAEVKRKIKQTLSKTKKKKKYKKEERADTDKDTDSSQIVISEFTSVNELAKIMDIPATEIILKFFKMGKNATINQRLDKESLEMICHEFDFDVTFEQEYGTDIIEVASGKHKDVEELPRPPVVTVMGHVDHGKTSILDYIRSTNVASGETGHITQHIGAYQITHNNHAITFLDTPGHEAFTAMRARGANLTDIAVIVVAADDSVMPQTIEAIDHTKASGVELIIAINKIDLKTANLDRVIADLSKHNILLENYGGDIVWTTCSAITGQGIDDLLDAILLVTEMKELKAQQKIPAAGTVIEAKKDSKIGTIATVLIKEGTLSIGDAVVCGASSGKVRSMENERGEKLQTLYPSDVALIFGLNDVPKEGDILNKVENEKTARQISIERKSTRQERERFIGRTNTENLFMKIKEKEKSDIKLIVKADTDGSVEAFCDAIQKLSNDEVMVNIIHKGVGAIVEADVNLAIASNALIVGFHVRADNKAKKLAEDNNVEIKTYQIIYEGINDIKKALEGLIEPDYKEVFVGSAVVKQIFKIKGVGVIAGCAVDKGKILKNSIARLYRNNGLIFQGKLSSLKHFAEDVSEVKAGSECGIGIHNFNDIKEGDIIEAYIEEEVQRTLD